MVSESIVVLATVGLLALVTVAGVWYARGRVDTVEAFVTARGTTGTGLTAATVVASSMGAWILFSPAEAGAAFGGVAAVAGYAVGSASAAVAYVFVGPRIRRAIPAGHTLTEYARLRYGRPMYVYVLLVSGFYMFMALAANMTGIVGVLSLVADVPPWQTAGLVGGFVLVYTAYGGLKASIFTDAIQLVLILPLLALAFVATLLALGGPAEITTTVSANDPTLLDPGFVPGLLFGVYVVIAIVGAELLNQAWWQRVYAARDERTVRRSYALSGVVIVPIILLAGSFGVIAAGYGFVTEPGDASVALFLVVLDALPGPLVLLVTLLAVLLVMSSADTLFNAIASVVTVDLAREFDVGGRSLSNAARLVTVGVALGAILIGSQAYSVLALFLTADLFAVATAVPLLAGLYSRRVDGRGVLVASALGLAVGVAFMPTLHAPLSAIPILGAFLPAPSFLWAFLGAAAVSSGLTVLAALLGRSRFDAEVLEREVTRLDDVPADD